MSFAPAKFKNRSSKSVSPLRYAVRKSGQSTTRSCIQILLDQSLAAKAGIAPGAGVRLDFDEKLKLGRIIAIERENRAFRTGSNRGGALTGSWPHNSDIERLLPRSTNPDTDIVPLVVSEASRAEGLVFELPNLE